jgi:hypothetical protein
MAHAFYPFVENDNDEQQHISSKATPQLNNVLTPAYAARIAVVDTPYAQPRVVVIDPCNTREYLEEITATVAKLASEQGSSIPFMVIREIVENFIHAYFVEPTISILNHGNTIRFADQGPGIKEKEKAFAFGTTSATQDMKKFIRGVGSGLPYVRAYMEQTHGSIVVEDNIAGGTIVTLNAHTSEDTPDKENQSGAQIASSQIPQVQQAQQMQQQQQQPYTQPVYAQPIYTQPTYATNPYTNTVAETPVYTNPAYTNPANTGHLPAQMPIQQPSMQPAQQAAAPGLSERAVCVLRAVCTYGAIGPSELARMFGFSQPTWSRELQALETMGVLHRAAKEQKRTLTQLGQDFVRQHNITPL